MIHKISVFFARRIALATNQLENEDYIRYGLEVIVGYFIKISILLLLAIYFHLLILTLLLVIPFITIRLVSGGAHLTTYISCLAFSLFWFLFLAWVSKLGLFNNYLSLFIFLHLVITVNTFITYKYVPIIRGGASEVNKMKQKRRTIFLLFFWYMLLLIGFYYQLSLSSLEAVMFGLLLQFLSITPFGLKLIRIINNSFIERRGSNV